MNIRFHYFIFLLLVLISFAGCKDNASTESQNNQVRNTFWVNNKTGEDVSCNYALFRIGGGGGFIPKDSNYEYQMVSGTLHFTSFGDPNNPNWKDYGYYEPEPGDVIILR